jgi:hypothetical protein
MINVRGSADRENEAMTVKLIVSKLITVGLKAGYMVSVDNGEEFTVKRSTDKKKILAGMFQCDEDWLHFRKADGEKVGVVALMYGECGYDVICDYHTSLSHLMPEVDKLADFYEEHFCR